jgi:hypothetical protein
VILIYYGTEILFLLYTVLCWYKLEIMNVLGPLIYVLLL